MKTLYTSLFALLFSLAAAAQSGEVAKEQILLSKTAERLEKEIQLKQDSLRTVNKRITYLEQKKLVQQLQPKDEGLTLPASITMEGKIRPDTEVLSKPLALVNKGDTLQLTGYKDGYWIVNKGAFFGYINEMFILDTEETNAFKAVLVADNKRMKEAAEAAAREKERIEAEKEQASNRQQAAAHRAAIIKKYGKETGEKILAGRFWLGMTKDMAVASLGRPYRINRSVGNWGVSEQWVYSSIYLYFDNGILRSFQD